MALAHCPTTTTMDTIHPGYQDFTTLFSTLISTMPPRFMYRNDADDIQTTIAVIDNVLDYLSSAPGASNWGADNGVRWNDAFYGLVHGLRAVHAYLGKGKEKEAHLRLVVVVERAERLILEFIVPLTRLAELVRSSLSLLAQLTFFWQAIGHVSRPVCL